MILSVNLYTKEHIFSHEEVSIVGLGSRNGIRRINGGIRGKENRYLNADTVP